MASFFSGDPNSLLTYTSPSTKWILGANGLYTSGTTLRTEYDTSSPISLPIGLRIEESSTNLFLNSRTPATQSVTTTATSYTVSGVGAAGATIVLSGSATGTLTGTAAKDRDKLTVTATAGTLTLTVTGTWDFVQVEAKSFATSPIVTAGSTVTRAADNISLATSQFPSMTVEGYIFAWVQLIDTVGPRRVAQLNNANVSDYTDIHFISSVWNGLADGLTVDPGVATSSTAKIGYTFKTGAQRYCVNGGTVATNTRAMSTAFTILQIGNSAGSGQYLSGHLKSLMLLPRYLSAAELQAATA